MRNAKKPAFILAIVAVALSIIGIGMMPRNKMAGEWVLYAGFAVGVIVWIWSVWDVIIARDLKQFQKMFWLILTVAVPMFGGLLFYIMHQRPNKIVT